MEAQPYFNVSQASLVLEGIVFDRNNNLLFVDVATGRVFKLTWWSDDFSIGRIRAGTVSLFTSVTGNEWSGRPGNAGPGQGVNSSGSLKAA